ncbi:prepilin-type N-terminal cleavage/methylation domain-containing protein [Roseiconus lacunae]|uniref:prepilin-type N-terminal cleavage/methylation domain-containing protein n=1 Tax=Roseiconus lacunae TaxID=2605694 RepID=UPI003F538894
MRRGLTLIELLAAMALSALLLSAVIGITKGVSQQATAVEEKDLLVWPSQTVAILRRDLLSADSVWNSRNAIWLKTDAPSYHSPSMGARYIRYDVKKSEHGGGILRRVDSTTGAPLAINVNNIRIERLDASGVPQPFPPSPGPVPDQVRLWVEYIERGSFNVFIRDIVIR